MKRYLSLWLILTAVALAGCGSAPAETAAPKPTEPIRAIATQPVKSATAETPTTPSPTAQPPRAATPTISAAAPSPPPAPGSATGLTVEEHPIASKGEATPDRVEYRRRIAPAILEKRRAWRSFLREGWADRLNTVLAGFNYRLAGNERSDHPSPLYNLIRGDVVVLKDVAVGWPISVSARGDDFALLVETKEGRAHLIRRSGVEPWDSMRYAGMTPVFVGNDLMSVEMGSGAAGSQQYTVLRGDEAVHRFEAEYIVANPLKGLWSWQGHWVLEVDGKLLVDGKSFNEEMGYDEVFGWQLLGSKPFYFFEKGGEVGTSYDGQPLPYRYEEVIHYRCCEPGAFNVGGNDTMVWFHALRDGVWHYVEIGSYDTAPRPAG